MTTNTVSITDDVARTIIFTTNDSEITRRINPNLVHNFIDIVTLNITGQQTPASAGEFIITFRSSSGSGFQTISDNGTIQANTTGGTGQADGISVSASFASNPHEIKIVPNGVLGVSDYTVTIRQNLT